jgi:hypothetical protein
MEDPINEWSDDTQPRDTARPRFYVGTKKNQAKSLEAGRPVFDDIEYVEIHTPGDKSNIPVKPVTDEHRRRWPRHYEQFKAGREQMGSGQPLREWAAITPSMVAELAHFKVHTVEDLAAISDGALKNIGPLLSLRTKAQDFIAQGKRGAPSQKLRAELDAANNEREVLKRQVAELAADLKKLHEARK